MSDDERAELLRDIEWILRPQNRPKDTIARAVRLLLQENADLRTLVTTQEEQISDLAYQIDGLRGRPS